MKGKLTPLNPDPYSVAARAAAIPMVRRRALPLNLKFLAY